MNYPPTPFIHRSRKPLGELEGLCKQDVVVFSFFLLLFVHVAVHVVAAAVTHSSIDHWGLQSGRNS